MPLNDAEVSQAAADMLLEIAGEEFPYLAEHVMQHLTGSGEDGVFEFVLDVILDGVDRDLPSRGSSSRD